MNSVALDRGTDAEAGHVPVMCAEMIETLAPADGAIIVDGTFGGGGYSRALLEAANCEVWAVDRDPAVRSRAQRTEEAHPGRFHFVEGRFGVMDRLLGDSGVTAVQGVVLDLGVSSMQLEQPGRGFSFQHDGPLDMRMSDEGPTAADIVNGEDEAELAGIIFRYGEERKARRIARAITAAREIKRIETTGELAEIIKSVAGRKWRPGIHPATRTFQAIRIHVNDELGELTRGLSAAERLLAPGGRLSVISFHSLEDRIVKRFLRARAGEGRGISRHEPAADEIKGAKATGRVPSFELLFRRALRPGDQEIRANPRARSARLRAAVRTSAAPWPEETRA